MTVGVEGGGLGSRVESGRWRVKDGGSGLKVTGVRGWVLGLRL